MSLFFDSGRYLNASVSQRMSASLGVVAESQRFLQMLMCIEIAMDHSTTRRILLFNKRKMIQDEVNEVLDRAKKRRFYRRYYRRPDYWSSDWGNMLRRYQQDEDRKVYDERSRKAKLFRRRFRVPFSVFVDLLEKSHAHNLFECKEVDAFRRKGIPHELKLLGVLRMLGKGGSFDDVAMSTLMSEESTRIAFNTFCKIL